MPAKTELLKNLRVASPCHIGWEQMTGDERIRFCDSCKLSVYNFSEMTEREIERLLREKEGRVCGRIYRRADGTLLTRDCPVGLAAVRRRIARFGTAVFATLISMCSVTFSQTKTEPNKQSKPTTSFSLDRIPDPQKTGMLTGTVMDPTGAIIIGAQVSLLRDGENNAVVVKVDQRGKFTFRGLATGQYEMTVTAVGFQTRTLTHLALDESQSHDAVIRLEILETTIGLLLLEPQIESPTNVPMITQPYLIKKPSN